jgi:hypothetical protein
MRSIGVRTTAELIRYFVRNEAVLTTEDRVETARRPRNDPRRERQQRPGGSKA